jgi:magnesium-transporting ATPase (P-type)
MLRVRRSGFAADVYFRPFLLETTQAEETPLQKRLARVGRTLLFVCLGIVGIVAAIGVLGGERWLEVFMWRSR